MKKTIIERLGALGFSMGSAMPQKPGGLILRTIGRARCESCDQPHLYALSEVLGEEMSFKAHKWIEIFENPLGSFCNSCGTFSPEEHSKCEGYLRHRLLGVSSNLYDVIEALEDEAKPLQDLSAEQLKQRITRFENQLTAARMALAALTHAYRD